MAGEREELTRVLYELQAYREDGQLIQQQLASLQASMTELEGSLETISNIKGLKDDVLLPVGAGVHLRAKITDDEKVLLDVGGNVIAEKTVEEAKAFLSKRAKMISELRDQLQKNLMEVSNQVMRLDEEAKRISSRIRAGSDVQPSEK